MATNPMQRKSRISFLLGMLLMLIIAALVIALLYMKIQEKEKEIKTYQQSTLYAYVLSQDVKSGQALTPEMFSLQQVSKSAVPADASGNITTILEAYKLTDKEGRQIYLKSDASENAQYYYYMIGNKEHQIYTEGNVLATALKAGDSAYFYAGDNNTERTDVIISENAVVAKVDMNKNTIITRNLISRGGEATTNDLRKAEYNVIDLPVDLAPDEYVDIRFTLPTGEDYIVASKKQVSIPVVDGVYSTDTIQMKLNESEIMCMSCAIVENYKIPGSKLYAVRYSDAGIQDAATTTYIPSTSVVNLIKTDPNVVNSAIKALREPRKPEIDNALNANSEDASDNISEGSTNSKESAKEQRKLYLQSLPATTSSTTTSSATTSATTSTSN